MCYRVPSSILWWAARRLQHLYITLHITPASIKSIRPSTERVSIEEGQIIWRTETDLKKVRELYSRRAVSGSQLLDDFLGLGNRDEKALRTFARKYGPLGLCKHGFALGHRSRDFGRCHELDWQSGIRAREPVNGWWRYISRAEGALTVADNLRRGRKTEEADWSWLYEGIPRNRRRNFRFELEVQGHRRVVPDGARLWPLATLQEGDPLAENPLLAGLAAQKRSTLKEQKQVLANVLNQWLDEGETGLSVAWKSEIDVRLGVSHPLGIGNRLLTSIGVQLLSQVLLQRPRVRCDICHRIFPPKKARNDRANLCPRAECKQARNKMRVYAFRTKNQQTGVHK